jgi:hypothetical protein
MQEDRQLARNGHDRSLPRVPPSAIYEPLAGAAQVAVHSEWTQDVVSRLHEELADELIASFRDSERRARIPRVALPRAQAKVRTHFSALREPVWILEREHVGE